ncbi:hypothetical protein E2562_022381 [Oryza meyeriana var. granulata]|uniref:DUF834 domain-containing protein n=1 Tax=Oryza meyeriana var. granulata TaxID=110450 RepID=A0A6G1EY39_9ORYZ|nr:hypothetical protein E2562_022381 [Oryza meyeriana var. granulata]
MAVACSASWPMIGSRMRGERNGNVAPEAETGSFHWLACSTVGRAGGGTRCGVPVGRGRRLHRVAAGQDRGRGSAAAAPEGKRGGDHERTLGGAARRDVTPAAKGEVCGSGGGDSTPTTTFPGGGGISGGCGQRGDFELGLDSGVWYRERT